MTVRHSMRVLLVEDNPGDARLIRELLRGAPQSQIHVEQVDRLSAAIEKLTCEPWDVVLLDLSLPDAHGLETVERTAFASDVPIVVLTGDSDDEVALRALKVGAQDFLVKGTADGELLVRTMRYAIERRRAVENEHRLLVEQAARAQADAKAARAYQEARAREELLAIVSHDLRNPLSVIGITLSSLKRELDPTRPRSAQLLDKAQRAFVRMERLIQDLLDLARIEAGHFAVNAGQGDLANAVADLVDLQRPLAAAKSINLVTALSASRLMAVIDRERIAQALTNLVGNAIKFTPAGGTITVSVEAEEAFARVEVRDTGPGIAAENLPHIFDRFFQVRGTSASGAGLGLAIAKGIVESHGGSIWATSVLGQGTTFCFTVPLEPVMLATAANAGVSAASSGC